MNAGISPTSAMYPDQLTTIDSSEPFFKFSLDSSLFQLKLPAGKVGPIIFNIYTVIRQ